MPKIKEFSKKYIPNFLYLALALLILSVAVLLIARVNFGFADFVNSTVSHAVRAALAFITYILPFSLFEILILLLIPLLVFITVYAVRLSGRVRRVRFVLTLLSLLSFFFTSFVFTLGVGYRASPLSDKLGLGDTEVTRDNLYNATLLVREELNLLSEEVNSEGGVTDMPYSVKELSDKLIDAYDTFEEEYGVINNFKSRVKPVIFGGVMADAGITGIYSYFTGEANISLSYADFSLPFTAAHELAHQRGIARENEANFVAFLVCISSEDAYIRYGGYLNMYMYLSSALYHTDKEAYHELEGGLAVGAYTDREAYYAMVEEHSDSFLNKFMDRVNDTYLKANGTEGVVSYGLVVRLAVAYYG